MASMSVTTHMRKQGAEVAQWCGSKPGLQVLVADANTVIIHHVADSFGPVSDGPQSGGQTPAPGLLFQPLSERQGGDVHARWEIQKHRECVRVLRGGGRRACLERLGA